MKLMGHIPDVSRPEGLVHHSELVGVGDGPIPTSITLPARIDHQNGQDCTGSYAINVETFCAFRGIPCDIISRRFSYRLGCMISNPNGPQNDNGAYPSSVVQGMRSFGVVAEATCPGDGPDVINNVLEFYKLEIACLFKVTQIAVIEDFGADLCTAFRRALAAGFPIAFGMTLDQAFMDLPSGQVYDGPTGAIIGSHALRVVGYKPGMFLIANSWGTSWCDGGFCWLSDNCMGSAAVFDKYALNFAPAVKVVAA